MPTPDRAELGVYGVRPGISPGEVGLEGGRGLLPDASGLGAVRGRDDERVKEILSVCLEEAGPEMDVQAFRVLLEPLHGRAVFRFPGIPYGRGEDVACGHELAEDDEPCTLFYHLLHERLCVLQVGLDETVFGRHLDRRDPECSGIVLGHE